MTLSTYLKIEGTPDLKIFSLKNMYTISTITVNYKPKDVVTVGIQRRMVKYFITNRVRGINVNSLDIVTKKGNTLEGIRKVVLHPGD